MGGQGLVEVREGWRASEERTTARGLLEALEHGKVCHVGPLSRPPVGKVARELDHHASDEVGEFHPCSAAAIAASCN